MLLRALAAVFVALVAAVGVLLVAFVASAGVFLVARLVGSLFGVATLDAALIVLGSSFGVGLLVWSLFGPSRSEVPAGWVPPGGDEPEAPHYNEEGDAHCPNCRQSLALPRRRPERRPAR